MESAERSADHAITFRTLGPFLGLAFGLTWGIGALLVLFPARVEAVFGTISGTNPLFILAAWGPALAAIFLVWRHYGLGGLGRYFRRLALWRMPAVWWVVVALIHPALSYAGAAINGTISDPFPFSPWSSVLPATALALIIGPVEEFGWRGMALPLFQRRLAPFWAGVVLGAIWAAWHLPVFFMSGSPQYSWSFAVFVLGVVAMSLIMTALFNASRGSILVAVLFHWQANQPAWPDGMPWSSLLLIVVAVLVVWLNRGAMFRREGAVTDVLFAATESRSPVPT